MWHGCSASAPHPFPLNAPLVLQVASRIIASAHVTEHIQVALEGASKMFVGDIIETGV